MSDDGNNRQSDLAVMEANEIKQKTRLNHIIDKSIHGVHRTAKQAWQDYALGSIGREGYLISFKRAVSFAILDCYKLLYDYHRQCVSSGETDRYWRGDPSDPIAVVEVAGEKKATIVGLEDFLDLPNFHSKTFTETLTRRNMPDTTVSETVEKATPENVSRKAFHRLVEFLDDVHDMEISFEEMEDDDLPMITGFDMSDPEGNGNGTAESTDVQFNGSPDI